MVLVYAFLRSVFLSVRRMRRLLTCRRFLFLINRERAQMVSRSFWRVGDHGFPPVRSLRIFDSIFFLISSCCLLISLYSALRFLLQPFCSALARIDLRRFGRFRCVISGRRRCMYFWTIRGSEAFNRLGLGMASLVEWPRNVSCTRSIQSILWSDGQPL